MDEPIHRREASEDDQGLEIGGGRVRAMVQAVERRAQQEKRGEKREREGSLSEAMKKTVRTMARRAEHELIPLEMQWMKERMRSNLKKTEKIAVEPFPREKRDAIIFESVGALEKKIDEWLIQYGRKNVHAAVENVKSDLKKEDINRYLKEICREIYCRIESIFARKMESRKVDEHEEEEDDLEDDLELLGLNGDEEEVDEDSLLASFEMVDAVVDCNHQCSPSHAHHHSRIEQLHRKSTVVNSSAEVSPAHNTQRRVHFEDDDRPFDLLPQHELGLSGVPFRLDCKTQAYWMAVTEQWAAERVGMK